jgi:hypothetical protein
VKLGSLKLLDLALEIWKLPGSFRELSMKVFLPIPKFLKKSLVFDWKSNFLPRNYFQKVLLE